MNRRARMVWTLGVVGVVGVTALAPAAAAPVGTARRSGLVRAGADDVPSRGPRDALVTVELFCNFAHQECATAERLLRRVAERHPDGLRVLYRQVVLPNRDSLVLAAAAAEAFRQGRFLELADVAAARGGPLRARDVETAATRAGMSLDELRAALSDERHSELLERDALRREALGVGTIGLVWNGEPDTSKLSLEMALRAYGRAHARATAHLADGVPRDELFDVLSREARAARPSRPRPELAQTRARVRIGEAAVRGDPAAPVSIVVFSDFECSFCRRQEEVLRKLQTLDPERVRVIFKHFPVARPGGGRTASDTAECARRQGRFWELHDLLLEGPVRRRERDLEQAAVAAGVELERLRADLPACRARVDADLAEGQALGVESPPTLFVNGLKLVGMRPLSELRLLVEDETAPGILGQLGAGH